MYPTISFGTAVFCGSAETYLRNINIYYSFAGYFTAQSYYIAEWWDYS
jgi:hypothetical protein